MANTLKQQIAADTTSVFLNTDEFAGEATFYPKGMRTAATTVTCVITQDGLEGTREARGDGVTFDRKDGYSIRESVIVETPTTVNVQEKPRPDSPDVLVVGGQSLYSKRVIGRDDDMVTVLFVRRRDLLDRKPSMSG